MSWEIEIFIVFSQFLWFWEGWNHRRRLYPRLQKYRPSDERTPGVVQKSSSRKSHDPFIYLECVPYEEPSTVWVWAEVLRVYSNVAHLHHRLTSSSLNTSDHGEGPVLPNNQSINTYARTPAVFARLNQNQIYISKTHTALRISLLFKVPSSQMHPPQYYIIACTLVILQGRLQGKGWLFLYSISCSNLYLFQMIKNCIDISLSNILWAQN